MKHSRRLLVGTLTAAVGVQATCLAHAKRSYAHYRNVDYGVEIDVPTGWTVSPQTDDSMLTLHLKRPGQKLNAEDCTFEVIKTPATLRQSQADINKDFRGDQNHLSVRFLLMLVPEATGSESKFVEQSGRTTLFVESAGGTGEETFRSYQVSFGVPGKSFDGSCQARPMHYAQQRAVFEHILRSLSPIE